MTRKRVILGLSGLGIAIFILLIFYFKERWQWESTDNAYVKADISTISAKITSYVEDIAVSENQFVKKGEILIRLKAVETFANLQESEANINLAQASLLSTDAKIKLQNSIIMEKKADVESSEIEFQRTKNEYDRTLNFGKTSIFSKKQLEAINATYLIASAKVKNAKATLSAAELQIPILLTEQRQNQAKLLQAQARRVIAEEDYHNTQIIAPFDGVVGNKSIQLGQLVRPGQQLISLVPINFYIYANFKETQLDKMQPGQEVLITLDSYPNHEFQGQVDGFSPASGAVFSLLPPENATGNFTKIVQRMPVKIVFDSKDFAKPIRPGMSAQVKVKIKSND